MDGHKDGWEGGYTVEPRSKAPAYKALPAYKAFTMNLFSVVLSISFWGIKLLGPL